MLSETESLKLKQKLVVAYVSWLLEINKTAIIDFATHYQGNCVTKQDQLNGVTSARLQGVDKQPPGFKADEVFDVYKTFLRVPVGNDLGYQYKINIESIISIRIDVPGTPVVVSFEVETPGLHAILAQVKREKLATAVSPSSGTNLVFTSEPSSAVNPTPTSQSSVIDLKCFRDTRKSSGRSSNQKEQ